jgi:hypothetical protein
LGLCGHLLGAKCPRFALIHKYWLSFFNILYIHVIIYELLQMILTLCFNELHRVGIFYSFYCYKNPKRHDVCHILDSKLLVHREKLKTKTKQGNPMPQTAKHPRYHGQYQNKQTKEPTPEPRQMEKNEFKGVERFGSGHPPTRDSETPHQTSPIAIGSSIRQTSCISHS